MNKALIDTDIYSELLKAINPNVARNAVAYRRAHGILTLSVITLLEIIYGFQRAGTTHRIPPFRLAAGLEELLPLDQASADLAGRITGDLDRAGRPIGRLDPMIAAVALTHGLELVTGNTSHYQFIQQLGYPLVLSNWRS